MKSTVLFESDDLLVRTKTFDPGGSAVLTFDSYTDHQTLDRKGFGEDYFCARSISAVHVINRDNSWYQLAEMDDAIRSIRGWAAQFDQILAYGSSMGGYAALSFGAECGACRGFAISPQFSVDPLIAPFERRWAADVAKISFVKDRDRPFLPMQLIAFDPNDEADAKHAALFAARSPTVLIRALYGGHPVGAFLNETGLLVTVIEHLLHGDVSPEEAASYEAELHHARRKSGQYLSTLADAIPDHRPRQRMAIRQLATIASPEDPGYSSMYASLLDSAGHFDEAYIYHQQAIGSASSGPYHSCRYAKHLMLVGRLSEARALAEAIAEKHPHLMMAANTRDDICIEQWRQKWPAWINNHPVLQKRLMKLLKYCFQSWLLVRRKLWDREFKSVRR